MPIENDISKSILLMMVFNYLTVISDDCNTLIIGRYISV